MPVKNRISELHAEITAWRRDIHAHPETMYDTHRTSALVAAKLREFGCDEVVEGIGRTGVVGLIRGRACRCGPGGGPAGLGRHGRLGHDLLGLARCRLENGVPLLVEVDGDVGRCG